MIIFSNNIIPTFYGDDKYIVLNYTSYLETYKKLTQLNVVGLGSIRESKEFDLAYADYIFNNPYAFKEFIDVMRFAYNGAHVILLVDQSEYAKCLTETLSKLITERYGYVCQFINVVDDIECLDTSVNFSSQGLNNFDIDNIRYFEQFSVNDLWPEFINMFIKEVNPNV